MVKVIQFRAGMPDKFKRFTSGDYELVQRDGVQLSDYSVEQLARTDKDTYFLPLDDEDVAYANTLPLEIQKRVMLPAGPDGRIIDYHGVVSKDSEFYRHLSEHTPFQYSIKKVYYSSDFDKIYDDFKDKDKFVLKTTLGAGSRGVACINSERVPQPGAREQFQSLQKVQVDDIIHWAKKRNCEIMVQDLAYRDLKTDFKFDLSFILRDGKLIAYHWSHPDNDSTNWDHGEFIRNEFTENAVNKLVAYLVSLNITNGFFNLDGYTDYKDWLTMIEVNWRLANCVFIFEAWGIDYVDLWLYPEKKDWNSIIPFGVYPYIRYWRCSLFNLQKGGDL